MTIRMSGSPPGTLSFDSTHEPPAGCWVIGDNLRVYVAKAPTRWQAWWTRRLLGWVWRASL